MVDYLPLFSIFPQKIFRVEDGPKGEEGHFPKTKKKKKKKKQQKNKIMYRYILYCSLICFCSDPIMPYF